MLLDGCSCLTGPDGFLLHLVLKRIYPQLSWSWRVQMNTGANIAEYFMAQGSPTCTVYDDLTKHAISYREMCLTLRRPPAREAYPGDVTALPLVEAQEGDVSAEIPTSVSVTNDGQLVFWSNLLNNVGISVSRVGSAAQPKIMKQVALDGEQDHA